MDAIKSAPLKGKKRCNGRLEVVETIDRPENSKVGETPLKRCSECGAQKRTYDTQCNNYIYKTK